MQIASSSIANESQNWFHSIEFRLRTGILNIFSNKIYLNCAFQWKLTNVNDRLLYI